MNRFLITKYAGDEKREYKTDSVKNIQAGYFTDIRNQIFSTTTDEIIKETDKEIERWKKERLASIKARKKEMEIEKKNNYSKIGK